MLLYVDLLIYTDIQYTLLYTDPPTPPHSIFHGTG